MKDTLYAIYKFDFHQATNRSVIAESNGVDGSKNVKFAQKCFESRRVCQMTLWQKSEKSISGASITA